MYPAGRRGVVEAKFGGVGSARKSTGNLLGPHKLVALGGALAPCPTSQTLTALYVAVSCVFG